MARALQGQMPIRATTWALAAMQTTINAAGLAVFGGDLDRFAMFALIVAQTHRDIPGNRPIAANSLAMSLVRPFETVRRHVNALIARGLCERVDGGITVTTDALDAPEMAALCDTANDAFVNFVEDLLALGLLPPLPPAGQPRHAMIGVQSAVHILFEVADSNRVLHADWMSLTIFSTILRANAAKYEAFAPLGGVPLRPAHAVRASVIARMLNVPETTIRRRLARLTAPGGPVIRYPEGLLVSVDWLDGSAPVATSAATYAAIRRVIIRAAVNGFPFDDPASAYRVGRRRPRID